MAVIDTGSSTAGKANVDSNYQLNVTTNTDPEKAGAIRMFSENDAGTVTGAAQCLSPETSTDYRLRVGLDVALDNETFNYTNQNTAKYDYRATTMTIAQSSGRLNTNATGITTLNTGVQYRTWQYFPIVGQQSPLYVEFTAALSAALTTNTTIDFGLFLSGGSNPFAPTDGIYFRINSSGFLGVANYNNSETTTSAFTFTHTISRAYQFLITITEREVQFWIDDVLYGSLPTQSTQGQPCMSASLPMAIRHAIGGTAAGAAMSFQVYDYSVQLGDVQSNIPYAKQMAMMGGTLQVQPAATTGGQLTTYGLGAEPSAVTLTASTAPATNTLGGLFILPATITTAASDYPLFAWLNPVGTTAIQGKTFLCTGIRIGEMTVTTALTGGPLIVSYAIGFGSTASSLATTETASFTATTTKIARKVPLGVQALAATAAVGTIAQGFQVDFGSAPIPIHPGEYLHIIIRCLGTNTTAGVPRGSVAVLGYFRY